MGHQRVNARLEGLEYMFHIGYEPMNLFNLVGPEMYILPLVILGVDLLDRTIFEFLWICLGYIPPGSVPSV